MLKVSDIMAPDPAITEVTAPLQNAIRLMKKHACRQLPVVQNGRLVGIITDRDIRLAMNSPFVLHDRTDDEFILENTTVGDCMTSAPLTISADEPATLAADLLKTYKFGGLPVVSDGRLVGIVTISDILSSYISIAFSLSASERS